VNHTLPAPLISQHTPQPKTIAQTPHEMQRPKTPVDLQHLSNHLRASVSNTIAILQQT
jgi:hypothetical protein